MGTYKQKGTTRLIAIAFIILGFCVLAISEASAAADIWDGTVADSFAGGDGSLTNPYQIATGAQLAYLANFTETTNISTSSRYFVLTADIDLNHHDWKPIPAFSGYFNGQNHIIYNLSIGTPEAPNAALDKAGLFGDVRIPSRRLYKSIQNLGLENVSIHTVDARYVGGLVGYVGQFCIITNCYTSGTIVVKGKEELVTTNNGGLIGISTNPYDARISNCCSTVNMQCDYDYGSNNHVGGLIGRLGNTDVETCYATGELNSENNGNIAGLIAYLTTSTSIRNSYWCRDALQYKQGVLIPEADRKATAYDQYFLYITEKTLASMQTNDFLDSLNAGYGTTGTWSFIEGLNNGYPVPFTCAPNIEINPSDDKVFTAQVAGYGAQTAHTVTVNNTGNRATETLNIALSGTNAKSFTLSKTSMDAIVAGGSGSFTVRPATGLSAGKYTATVTVSGNDVTSQTFDVEFTVIAAVYKISANPTNLDFGSKIAGYGAVDTKTVTVTNTGNVNVTLTQPTATNFTIGTLSQTTLNPNDTATFTITPKTGLAAGTYDTAIAIKGSNDAEASVDVDFTVTARVYSLAVSPTSLDFGSKIAGYGAVDTKTITITNTGNVNVTLTQPTATNFTIGTLSQTTLNPNDTATFTVNPKTGLTAGTYDTAITIEGSSGAEASVDVDFSVIARVYSLAVSPTSLDFGSKIAGYGAVDTKTITITNTGNVNVTLTQPTATNFTIGTLSQTTLNPNDTATFTVAPKTGLAAGIYDTAITIKGTGGAEASVDVDFSVIARVYSLAVSPTSLDFGSKIAGYGAVDTKTITITNTGNVNVTLTQPTATNFTIGTLSQTTLNPDDTATFTVSPKTGLAAGIYDTAIAIKGSNDAEASVNVDFTVIARVYSIAVNPTDIDFGSEIAGYGALAAKTVTITNTGNLSITLTQPTATNFTISTLSQTTLNPDDTATFTVSPKTGLAAGIYDTAIAIKGTGGAEASVDVDFSVIARVYSLAVSPTSLDFGSKIAGYGAVDTKTITITNTGNMNVTLTQPTATNFTIGTLSQTTLNPNDTATFTITPKTGLAASSYDTAIAIKGSNDAEASVDVDFTVTARVYSLAVSPTSLDFGSKIAGYGAVDTKTITITNTGNVNVTLTQPTATNFTIGTLSQTTLNPDDTATFTVSPKTSLAAGIYDTAIAIKGSNDAEASVNVDFTVIARVYSIAVNPTDIDFGSEIAGYGALAAKTVTITNTGNLSITLTQPTATNFTISTLSQTALNPDDTATFTVNPKTGLTAGTYDTAIAIKGSNDAEASVDVDFTVITAVYELLVDPIDTDFGSAVIGYNEISAKTVTLTNSGNKSITLTQPTATNYILGALSQTTLNPANTAIFTIRPKDSLPIGAYNETITVNGSDGTEISVDAAFAVEAEVYTIIVNPTKADFGSVLLGYNPIATHTVTVTNTGNRIISLVQPEATNYIVGSLNKTALNPGNTATFTIRPKDDLPDGTYSETIAVNGFNCAQAAVDTTFTVVSAVYDITPVNGTFIRTTGPGLTFTSYGEFSKFIGVLVDGAPLVGSEYIAKEGSTVVTLLSDYLDQLDKGSHTIRILFKDGYADAAFNIDIVPETGDNSRLLLSVVLVLLTCSVCAILYRKRIGPQ